MPSPVSSAAVLGAGTMGAQLAAHLANAGIPVTLFDVTADAAAAAAGRLVKAKPPPLFETAGRNLIATAPLDELDRVSKADWIIEAVVEDLEVKHGLLSRLAPLVAPDAIVSTNTSGIPIALMAEGLGSGFTSRWLGTHFFNPPRYLHLVEVIPTADTDPEVTARVAALLDRRLGKGVVHANDRPGFIANRLGLYAVLRVFEAMTAGGFTVEEVDALSGPLIGRPKSATFRTLDLSGLDIFLRVADDLSSRLGGTGSEFVAPALVRTLVRQGALGAKTGRGFYTRAESHGREILTLDTASTTYRPFQPPSKAGLETISSQADLALRLRALLTAKGRHGDFTRATLGKTLLYAADIASEVAGSIDDVDRAMRWGFGWAMGPFEIWDAVGIDAVLESCGTASPPPLVAERRRSTGGRIRSTPLGPASPDVVTFRGSSRRVVKRNPGASLVDLGDGVLGLDLHSKVNAIGGDTLEMLDAGLATAAESFQALVIGSDEDFFSAGANLTLLLLEAQEGNWDDVNQMVRQFQRATSAIRTSPVPVVVAARGLCLGGGCEIALLSDRVQAGAELYVGLVEASVGLIPAGGGSTELVRRSTGRPGLDPPAALQASFETAALARVSTGAVDARQLGYLRPVDGFSMNPDRVLADAKAVAISRARSGYRPGRADETLPVGGPDVFARLAAGVHLAWRAGRASDHDALVGRKLAWVMAGGDVSGPAEIPASRLLDLEREAFLSLCGEKKTRDRIAHTLKTGKPLRN